MTAACKSCAFFEDHAANNEQKVDNAGLCRFNPPVNQPDVASKGLWPVVKLTDWCGHFSSEFKAA